MAVFRTAYGPRLDTVVVDATMPGPTKLSMQDECDVNRIVERFRATGLVSHLAKGAPAYLDVSEVRDYREALEHVRAVGEFFSQLPAPVRAEFHNDAAAFLDFVTDPANADAVAERFPGDEPDVAPVAPVEPSPSDGV